MLKRNALGVQRIGYVGIEPLNTARFDITFKGLAQCFNGNPGNPCRSVKLIIADGTVTDVDREDSIG